MTIDVRKTPEAIRWDILFNGEPLKLCFAASEEEEWADIYVTNDQGIIELDYSTPQVKPKEQRIYGKVKLLCCK